MHYLEVANLSKSFNQTPVFNNISFDISQGEFITLLGPSGCGKSTLLRSLAGLITPDQGQIRVSGEDITWLKPQQRGIGMVFQSYALFPNLTVAGNIAFGLKMQRLDANDIKRRVAEAVALVGLEGREGYYPASLSGGQRQRVALARALVVRPRILLLDEATANVDSETEQVVQRALRALHGKVTLIVVAHRLSTINEADRILVMAHGELVESGSHHQLMALSEGRYRAMYRLQQQAHQVELAEQPDR